MSIQVEVVGEAELLAAFKELQRRSGDFRLVWPAITAEFYEIERDQFETQGGRAGGGWPALSPKYAAWKEVHYPGMPILQRTGRLMQSLTRTEYGDSIVSESSTELEIGTAVSYGAYHQSTQPRKSLPRRPPIEITSEDEQSFERIARDEFKDLAIGLGFEVVDPLKPK